MPREPFWTSYVQHREAVDRQDAELDAAHEAVLAMEAETYFTRGGLRDCI